MRVAGRHWTAAFAAAVLTHIGVALAVLWHASENEPETAASASIRVSFGSITNLPGSVAVAAREAPEAEAVTATETVAVRPAEVRTLDLPEPSAVRPIEAVETLAIAPTTPAVGAASFEEPASVGPEEATPVEAPRTVRLNEVPLTEASPLVETNEMTTIEVSPTVDPAETTPVEASPPIETVEVTPVETRSLVETSELTPIEARSLVETAEVLPDETFDPVPSVDVALAEAPSSDTAADVTPVEIFHTVQPVELALADGLPSDEPVEVAPPEASQPVHPIEVAPIALPRVRRSVSVAGIEPSEEVVARDQAAVLARAEYLAHIKELLDMQKKYPRRAVRRGQQGTVLIYLVVDRDGRLKEHGLRESSGHGVLDREALKLIERAQPLPAAPDDLDESTLELIVPVRFVLR